MWLLLKIFKWEKVKKLNKKNKKKFNKGRPKLKRMFKEKKEREFSFLLWLKN